MWRAKAGATIFRHRDEGIPLSILLGSFYLGYCAGVVTYLIEPAWMAWSAVVLPALVRWGGAVIVLFLAILVTWCLNRLGRNFAVSVVPKQQHTLVTTGPYAWVRHPLYSTFLVEALGISLLMSNWFVATMAGFLWALLVYRTRQEEEKLIERYGDAYRQYMNRVGRFFPRTRKGDA
jgi:protein-S-isoprenylcysteine O-methyltransferase Ste14